MREEIRCSGIETLSKVPWGTHFCQFYESAQDLLEVLVGYFQQGLRDNECCVWVTSEPLGIEEARSALRRAVPDLDERIGRGQIEFLDYRQWYLLDGRFDADGVLQGWVEKERRALARGYEGLRTSGNASWLDAGNWKAFTDCEAKVSNVIGSHRMLALCTYSLDKCRGVEMLDVLRHHPLALVKKGNKWEVIESTQQRKAVEMLTASEQRQKAILDTIPDPAWLKDKEGRFLAVNASWCRFFGMNAESVLGKTAFEFLPAPVAAMFGDQDRGVMQSRHPEHFEDMLRDKDGRVVWFETIRIPLLNDYGEMIGTTGLARNITERKQAEDALRESEERYRTLVENIGLGITLLDPQHQILAINRTHAEMIGRSVNECIGRKCYEVFEKRDVACPHCPGVRAMRSGRPAEVETTGVRDDGTTYPARVQAFPIHGSEGKANGFIEVVEDVTERKRAGVEVHALLHELQNHKVEMEMQNEELLRAQVELHEISDKYQDLFDFAPIGYFLLNQCGQILEVNLTGAAMLDLDRCTAVKRRFGQFVAMGSRARFAQFLKDLARSDGKQTCEIELQRNEDEEIEYAVVEGIRANNAEASDSLRITVTGITARKRAEEQLHHAKLAAEAANRAKSDFLANMSHEIRTPMTAVLGYSEVLLMPRKFSPREQRELLEGIQSNGKALLGLIDDILDLSRIEADRLSLEKTDCPLRLIVDEVISAVQVQAGQKGLSLEADYQFPLPEIIQTDRARLRQVLVNLVNNAVKFTGKGGVRIAIGCIRNADGTGQMRFAVTDTGIGIPTDKVEELFRPFMQVDASSTRRYGGSGLGLVISRRLANLLGGDIEVASELGKGSTFTVTIDAGSLKGVPMLQSPKTAPTMEEPLPEKRQPPLHGRVLFAEDAPAIRALVAFLLNEMNLEVDIAENGRVACEMAEKSKAEGTPYDLILMDIQMPVMNGYDATRWLRRHGWRGPIVALTAYAMVGDREKCRAAGCDDYLSKPMTREELGEVLARYIPGTDDTVAAQTALPPDLRTTPCTTVDRLREAFIGGLTERAQALEEAWRADDCKALAQVAHQLKGTSGAYGLRGMAQAAEAVERLAVSASALSEIQLAVNELLRHCRQAGVAGRSKPPDTPLQE